MIAIHQRANEDLHKTPLVLSGGEYENQEVAKHSASNYAIRNERRGLQMT